MEPVDYGKAVPKTKRVSVHMSGRVNYHDVSSPGHVFIPCLLDLTAPVVVAGLKAPSISAFDLETVRAGDHVILAPDDFSGSVGVEFLAVPANIPAIDAECWRFIVEGHYGLVCRVFNGESLPALPGVPAEAFSTFRPQYGFAQQAIPEDVAFIRFQELIYANRVRKGLAESDVPTELHAEIFRREMERGLRIEGPNSEGVWEAVCRVPMRIRPSLIVHFKDKERYRAEMCEQSDIRLDKVRVRFKIFDLRGQRWVKDPVAIEQVMLDAEL